MIKIIFIFCMLLSAGLVGFLPVLTPIFHKNLEVLSICNCFAAGIFIITGIAGLLPDAQKAFEDDLDSSMPLGYAIAALGYLLVFFIEKIAFGHSQDHHLELLSCEKKENFIGNLNSLNNELNIQPSRVIKNDLKDVIPGIILCSALVVHSIVEGIAVGLLDSKSTLVTISTGILIHNIPAALALGIKLKGVSGWVYSVLMMAFVISSPLSISIGIFLSDLGYPIIQGIFLSISAGTFIYIGCTEILPEEMEKPRNKKLKFLALLIGVIPLGLLAIFFN